MKKFLKWALIIVSSIIIVITALGIFLAKKYGPEIEKENAEKKALLEKKNNAKLDSIIDKIKTDKDIKVSSVDLTSDSILRIFITPENKEVNADAFDNLHQILSLGNVLEIEVYKKDKIVSTFGYKTQAIFDKFKSTYISPVNGSCKPVIEYIMTNINDPESFEHVKTTASPLINGNFEIQTTFRGRNAFGGKVLNSCTAEVSPAGFIVSFEMNK